MMSFLVLTACNIQTVEEYEKQEQESQTDEASKQENETTEKSNETEISDNEQETEETKKTPSVDKEELASKETEKNEEDLTSVPKDNPNPTQNTNSNKETEGTKNPNPNPNPNKNPSPPKENEKEPEKKPAPSKPNPQTPKKKYVTISIRVDTILKNMDKLDPALNHPRYVPKNGIILKQTKYELKDGENVFDILVRATRENKIHMEYQGANENQYGSVYIQGINHLYEFSVGSLSGWMYSVNGWYPNYGASKYKLKDGDKIEWNYTVDLGRDLGVFWDDEDK